MKRLFITTLKFLLIAPCCLYVWGMLMPGYVMVVAWLMTLIPGGSLESFTVTPGGILNTETILSFSLEDSLQSHSIRIASIVLNMPVFIALALASFRLSIKKFIITSCPGIGIIFCSHLFFLIFALRFQSSIAAAPEFPTALGQLLFCLPFLLWLLFFYRDVFPVQSRDGGEAQVKKETPPPAGDDVS